MTATTKNTHDLREEAFNPSEMARRVGAALRASFSGGNRDKVVARVARADPRTAQGWLQDRNTPRSTELLALMAANDEFEQEIAALLRELRRKSPCPEP